MADPFQNDKPKFKQVWNESEGWVNVPITDYEAEKDQIAIYGKFPAWIVELRVLRQLKPNQMAVLMTLVVLSGNTNRKTWVSRKTISEYSGVNEKSVSKATEDLEKLKIIKKWRQGYRPVYCIEIFPGPYIEGPGSEPESNEKKGSKRRESYTKDSKTGRFLSKGHGQDHVREEDQI